MLKETLINETIEGFGIAGTLLGCERYGSGHINETYLVTYDMNGLGRLRFIFQRISKALTKESILLMGNVQKVTEHLRKRIITDGGDPYREALTLVNAPDGNCYYEDSDGECWRVYQFVEGATCYDQVENPKDFYESGVAFGTFQSNLSDFDASLLHETIPGFHDTKKRLAKFKEVLKADVLGRAKDCQEEIDFVLSHEDLANVLGDLLSAGELPLRVTHNDTKLNNVMIDDKTGKGICVIDLDTVMPGLSVNDFGDSIRYGANTAKEDEKDLSLVSLDLDLYNTFLKGYLDGCNGSLTPKEIEMLPVGAKVMTYECGVRFLTDYLEGDVYFHISRPEHNLDRARTQFALVSDMERKWEQMQIKQ